MPCEWRGSLCTPCQRTGRAGAEEDGRGGGLPRRPPAPSLALEESRFAEADELRSSLRRYDSFCLNQEEESPDAAMRRELARFLHRYFPHPAPWELPEGPDGPSDSVP